MPDFLIRLATVQPSHLIFETKGFDPLLDVKTAAAARWVAAVNAEGSYGQWRYAVVEKLDEINQRIDEAVKSLGD